MAKKRMYLIKLVDGRRYWTGAYEKKDGLLVFRVNPRKGDPFGVNVNMQIVAEILEKMVGDDEVVPETDVA